jgi:lipid-A-disaccharide synthase
MARATVVLTLPGTSTAELAALGIPMVVCGPTYRLHDVPMPGLLGHVGRLPIVGRVLKHVATRVYASRMPFFAHPNRRAGRMVVPEIIGRITAAGVADALVATLSTPMGPLERTLMETMGPPGAADRLARGLLDALVHEWAR